MSRKLKTQLELHHNSAECMLGEGGKDREPRVTLRYMSSKSEIKG